MNLDKQKLLLGLFESRKYFCDDLGGVYSRSNNHGGLGGVRRIRPHTSRNGYDLVTLIGVPGHRITVGVHQLVALFFSRGYSPKDQVNHLDGDKLNNSWGNLEIVSASTNAKHSFEIGLQCQKGENNGASKLTLEEVAAIKAAHARGATQRAIAKKFGISFQNVHLIVRGKSWV